MAVQVREIMESRAGLQADGTDINIAKGRVFAVWDEVTPIADAHSIYLLLGSLGIPTYGDQYAPSIPACVAKSVSIDRYEEDQDIWKLIWSYTTQNNGGVDPESTSYIEYGGEIKAEFQDAWRQLPVIPADGTVVNPNLDIIGAKIDIAGEPTSTLRLTQDVTITQTIIGIPPYATYRLLRGKRNNNPFQGAEKGKVLYRGARFRKIASNKIQVEHSFLDDEQYHLVQIPRRNVKGDIAQDSLTPSHAIEVYWRQPFPLFGNFSALGIPGVL